MKSADHIRLELALALGAAPDPEDADKGVIRMKVTREGAETKLFYLRARLDRLADQMVRLGVGPGSGMYAEACQVQADINIIEELLENGSVVRELGDD